jgi:condensin complex subunit 1
MDDPIFRKLQAAVEQPCRSKEWFGLAEQAINTIYALGEHPDALCNDLIKKFTVRAFSRVPKPNVESQPPVENNPEAMDEDHPGDVTRDSEATAVSQGSTQEDKEKDVGDAFELSQLLFIVGHVAIKHIAHLELIEREWKRQKDEKQTGELCRIGSSLISILIVFLCIAEKQAANANGNTTSKEAEELDQVAGNAEDEIGDRIAGVRETELLYGPESLLALYGPMIVHICGSPHKFKVSSHQSETIFV